MTAAAGFVAFKALSLAGQEALGVAAAFVVGVGAFLAAHWLVLRLRAPMAGRLAIASLGGFLLAAVVTTAVGGAIGFEGEVRCSGPCSEPCSEPSTGRLPCRRWGVCPEARRSPGGNRGPVLLR